MLLRTPDAQAAELSRTLGRVRKVHNTALAARTEAWARQERLNYNQTSALLTSWKKTEVTLSTGEKIADPRHERRDRARLAKAQREPSRKAAG